MAEQYWIGDFFVDVTRNQITQKTQSQKIPPKALSVLTCLAKNANKVVSHDEILTEVWPDTVVTPNTLQRSIAQLRKALGENSQSYIKTHAKQGYSLEVEVRWQDKIDEISEIISSDVTSTTSVETETTNEAVIAPDKITSEKTDKKNVSLIVIIATVIIIALIAFITLSPAPSLKLSIAELNTLTATDDKEYGGIYTPDGQHVVFQRYSDKICQNNNIWAKSTASHKETQLTKNMGSYGSHSFSQNGRSLVFIESNNCDKPITQKLCYKLVSLDFQEALKQPQSPNVLVECKNSRIVRPKWLNNNNVAFMQESSNRWKLTSYSIEENKSTIIYELEDGNIINFDYSSKDDLIALTSVRSDGKQYIDILKPDGQVLSSHKIELPTEIPSNKFIYPNFTPYAEQLIFSTGRQLFTLSYDGKIANINLPLDQPISSPTFHPNAKSMLVIKGHYDSDIARMQLAKFTPNNTNQLGSSYSVIERSIKGESDAQFQPDGKLIAYRSNRSGTNQVWITDGKSTQQLSHFPIDTYLSGMDWAADGQSLLINTDKKLTRIFLDSKTENIQFEFPIAKLFQWNSENNTALVRLRIKGVLKLAELDLINTSYKIINDKKVSWALKSENGQLVYTDQLDQFWQSGPVEDKKIEPLISQGSDKGFIIKSNVIYGINEKSQLWSFALNNQTFKIIGNAPERIDNISDISQTDVLLTLRIAAKKEVAEIIFAD